MDNRPLFELEDVTVALGGCPVLHAIRGGIHRGSFLGLIGPNGAGKTTLIRTLAGALPPASGAIRLQGRLLREIPRRELASRLAVVPAELDMPVAFTVAECVAMGRMPYLSGWSRLGAVDRAAIRDAMETTDLLDLAQRPFPTLSGGERHRTLVAMALAQQPDILLLDEPTAHLDVHHAWGLMDLVQRLHRERNLTIVLSCHDLNLAGSLCTELLLLNRGRVHGWGETKAILQASVLREVYDYPLAVLPIGPRRCWVVPAWVADGDAGGLRT